MVSPLQGLTQPPAAAKPVITIKEVMEKTITPATNTQWNAPEAPTGEQWPALEEAIRARDAARLQTGGDPLYAPCEGCHSVFNPGVVGAAQ